MSAAPPLPAALGDLAMDHVAIAVSDLDAATAAYRALGLEVAGPDETVADQGVRVRPLRAGTALVELMAPLTEDGPVARFLARRGPGLHHVALRVTDLEALLGRLAEAGAPLLDSVPRRGRAGTRIAFVHPRFTGGVLVELVEPAP
jgi:methylmalonyl-CoA/ethylmalonyl-CoA epimerase